MEEKKWNIYADENLNNNHNKILNDENRNKIKSKIYLII